MNDTYNSLFLNQKLSPKDGRQLIVDFLKDAASELRDNPESAQAIAYRIAGIMATETARSLDNDDPINEILTIAGELETNPINRLELRSELVERINSLTNAER